jgi:hypothetical protein
MAQTKMQDFQMVHDAALPVLGKVARTQLKDIVDGVHTNFEVPYRIYAAATPDSKLYFKTNFVPDSDGGGRSVAPVLGSIPTLADSTIDFQTRLTTGATFTITWPSSTSGRFRRFGFILKSNGTIQVVYSAEAVSLVALAAIDPGAMFADIDGWYLGYVDLEATITAAVGFSKFKTAGSSTAIIENSVGGTARIYRLISAYEMGMNVKRSVVDAKGDLLAASANDTVTRLPVGADADILIADSSQTTGLRWTTTVPDSQITHTPALYKIGTVAGDTLNTVLATVDMNTDAPMRMAASNTPDAVLNFSSSAVQQGDDAYITVPPISNSVPTVSASSVNFQTQATTGTTFSINWPASTVAGQYYRLGFTLLATGTIQGIFSPTPSLAYPGTLPDPGSLFVSGSLPIGYIDLEATSATSQFKTANSATSIIENSKIYRFGSGGGTGSGEGTGAAKSPADGFKALVYDTFNTLISDANSKVDATFTKGTHDLIGQFYELKCDKTKTITTTGTSFTLSAAPSGFSVSVGDIIWSNSQSIFRRVATVLTTTAGTLDAAFPVDLAAGAGMVSQALWTKDLVNYGDSSQQTRLRDFFPSTDITSIHLEYLDSLATSDSISDSVSTALIVASASNSGLQSDTGLPLTSTFASIFTRPAAPNQILDYPLLANATKQRLFAVFFPNPSNATVVSKANILEYDISVYTKQTLNNGGYLNSAFCMSDSTGTPNNCSNPTVVSGKTRVTLSFNYVPGLNPGKPSGDLSVLVEGQIIPRFYAGVIGAYYLEVPGTTNQIEFWANLSALSLSIQVERRQGSIDTSDQNTIRLLALYDAIVGSAADVVSGRATHSTLQSAHDSISAFGKILVLPGATITSATITKVVTIEGKGYSSQLGALALTSSYCAIKWVTFQGNISIGGTGNFVRECWIGPTFTATDTGTGNSILIAQV